VLTIEIHCDCCCGLSLSDRFEICDLNDTTSDLSLTDRLFVSALRLCYVLRTSSLPAIRQPYDRHMAC